MIIFRQLEIIRVLSQLLPFSRFADNIPSLEAFLLRKSENTNKQTAWLETWQKKTNSQRICELCLATFPDSQSFWGESHHHRSVMQLGQLANNTVWAFLFTWSILSCRTISVKPSLLFKLKLLKEYLHHPHHICAVFRGRECDVMGQGIHKIEICLRGSGRHPKL